MLKDLGFFFVFVFLLLANTDFKIRSLKYNMKLSAFYIIGNSPPVMAEIGMTICYMAASHLPLSGLSVWFIVKKLSSLFP